MNGWPLMNQKIVRTAEKRLGIVQRVLTSYRVPFFDKLAEATEEDVSVFAGQPMEQETIKVSEALKKAKLYKANNRYLGGEQRYVLWQSNVLSWLREYNPDVLVVEANPRLLSHWLAIHWMHRRNRPVLGWGLGELPRAGFGLFVAMRRLLARRLMRTFDGLIAYSSKAKADYIAAGVSAERVFVAHNSIDTSESEQYLFKLSDLKWRTEWCKKNQLDPQLPIIVFVGRLIAAKRVDLLIRACVPLFDRCQLLIVGDGPFRIELERMASPFGKRVCFVGYQSGEALARCFIASDLFVLPGAGGLALHQAMSYGKPVIASFGDGTEADLIRDGYNGYHFRFGDVDDLTHKIYQLLLNPEQIKKMGEVSLAIVRNEINLENMAARFLQAVEATRTRQQTWREK